MKNELLLVLAAAWEQEAAPPKIMDGSESAKEHNAYQKGYRECKRECADALRILIDMLKDKESGQ